MFNLGSFKSLKSKFEPVKTVASKGFLSSLNNLDEVKTAKDKTAKRDLNTEDHFNLIYQEALKCFNIFLDSSDSESGFNMLHQSADKFSESIEIKKTKAEPYFYLSHIFFILKEITLAIKYLKIATFLNPDLNGLKQLRKTIEEYINDSSNNPKDDPVILQKQNISQPYKKPIFSSANR